MCDILRNTANIGSHLHEASPQAFYGAVIHSLSTPGHDLEILPSALLVVNPQGVITSFHKDVKTEDVENLMLVGLCALFT